MCVIAEELQLVGVMRLDQLLQKEAAKEAREHTHGQEEAWPAGHPARLVL
jgi:hypothetical protein